MLAKFCPKFNVISRESKCSRRQPFSHNNPIVIVIVIVIISLQLSDSDLQVSDLPHPVQSLCHELYRRSETGPSRLLVHVHGTNFHHRFVAFLLLLLLNVNLRHFYTITLLIHIVRRPCCVSALTSPYFRLFR